MLGREEDGIQGRIYVAVSISLLETVVCFPQSSSLFLMCPMPMHGVVKNESKILTRRLGLNTE